MMESISYLHSLNVYFGGVRPRVFEIFPDYSVKLGDFSLAFKVSDSLKLDDDVGNVKGYAEEFALENIKTQAQK